jgi:DivIVA domain-containing protein
MSPVVEFDVVLRGYDRAAVDDLVRRVIEALESDDPAVRASVRRELETSAISVRFRGYDRTQVDRFFRSIAPDLA